MHLDSFDWPAPAKLNLFLHVIGRRHDGYHLLQTLFQIIDLADSVRLRVTDDGQIRRLEGLADVAPDQDLAVRAAHLLKTASGVEWGADISVLKQIPVGAGLGGGSSDAATVLVALDAMWGTDLGVDRLAALGASLGADVPVFVRGNTAWAEGIGDQLTPVMLERRCYVVVFPDEWVSTASIFSDSALTRDTLPTTIPRLLSGEITHNDLQAVVCARHPRVADALNWLGGFAPARMSGSGSAVFAQCADRVSAEAIARQCPQAWQVFVVEGVQQSPLLHAVKAWREGSRQVAKA